MVPWWLLEGSSAWHHGSMPWLVRGAAVLFALSSLVVPGWGAIDLSVSWDPRWDTVLAAGWGVYFSVLVAVPFLVIAVRPSIAAPAVWTLYVAAGCLLIAAIIGLEYQIVGLLVWLGLGILVVAATGVVERTHPPTRPARRVEAAAAAAVAVTGVPWLVYGLRMAALNRRNLPGHEVSSGIDHYSVQFALSLALVALAVLASWWPRGRRQLGTYAGVCATYFGIVAYAWPNAADTLGSEWALAGMAWGFCAVGLSWLLAPAPAGGNNQPVPAG